MNIKELTQAMDDFVRAKGWYAENTPRPQTPANIAASISIEAAEILEHFQWEHAPSNDNGAIAGELADVALYLLQLAHILEIDLEKAIRDKLAFNYSRTWDQE